MNCPNCGAQNLAGAKFCAGCGAPLATAEQPAYQQPAYQSQQPYDYDLNQQPQYAPYPQQPKKPLNYKLIGIIAGVAALALILIFVLGGGHSNSPEGVAEAFLEAASDNDVDEVKDLLYGDRKDRAESYCPGDELDYEIKINDFEVIDKTEITDEEDLEMMAERCGIEANEIEEAVELRAEVAMEASIFGQTQKATQKAEFTMICVDGNWYVYSMS